MCIRDRVAVHVVHKQSESSGCNAKPSLLLARKVRSPHLHGVGTPHFQLIVERSKLFVGRVLGELVSERGRKMYGSLLSLFFRALFSLPQTRQNTTHTAHLPSL